MIDFHKIKAWEKAHRFALLVYKNTQSFPREEIYSLTSQLRRAAVSIPSNIAEGCGRGGEKELKQFMRISLGSASEAEYQILLAFELGYLPQTSYQQLKENVIELKKMIAAYVRRIN